MYNDLPTPDLSEVTTRTFKPSFSIPASRDSFFIVNLWHKYSFSFDSRLFSIGTFLRNLLNAVANTEFSWRSLEQSMQRVNGAWPKELRWLIKRSRHNCALTA